MSEFKYSSADEWRQGGRVQEIEVKAVKGNAKVKNVEAKSALTRALPKGSFMIRNPDGRDAHGEKEVSTLREEWEKYQNLAKGSYLQEGGAHRVVRVKENEDVGGVCDRIARAMGLPPQAVELTLPDGSKANPNWQVGTFRSKWL